MKHESVRKINEGMSMIVKTVCGWVKGFILVYGIHVILYGHLTPGGGFAGGVIAAVAFVLIALAEGEQAAVKHFSRKPLRPGIAWACLLFWLMAMLGIVVAGVFFANFWTTPESAQLTLFSSGIIPICNLGIGLKVCSSLYLVVLVLTAYRLRSASHDGKEEDAAMIYSLCFMLILIGLYGVLTRQNIIKIVISLLVIEYGIHLLLVLQGYRTGGVPPIVDCGNRPRKFGCSSRSIRCRKPWC